MFHKVFTGQYSMPCHKSPRLVPNDSARAHTLERSSHLPKCQESGDWLSSRGRNLSSLFEARYKSGIMPSGNVYEMRSGVSDAAGGDESGGHQPKKRQRKQAKKEYIPGVGTANYAFMIALFQVCCFTLIRALVVQDL